MSDVTFLEKLLDGAEVEWKALGEVTLPTRNIKWRESARTYRYIDLTSVTIDTKTITETTGINASNAPSRAQKLVEKDDLIFATTRPTQLRYCLIEEEYDGEVASTGYCILRAKKEEVLPRWILHWVSSIIFKNYLEENQSGSAYPAISDAKVKSFKIPIPCPEDPKESLKIQSEIVRILDSFTELTAELTAELSAEVTARRKQYNFYRERLLSFEEGEVEWKTLGEVAIKSSSGGTPLSTRADYYGGNIPWLRTQEVCFNEIFGTDIKITELALKESSAKWIPANCVIIAISGATAARSAINKIPLTTNQHCCNLDIDPKVANYRYVFHWVCNEHDQLKALGQGARGDLNVGIIKNYPIPIPYPSDPVKSLAEQSRIVAILDKFDTVTKSLQEGLPREVKLRQQQYEYYRNLLLSFPKPEKLSA